MERLTNGVLRGHVKFKVFQFSPVGFYSSVLKSLNFFNVFGVNHSSSAGIFVGHFGGEFDSFLVLGKGLDECPRRPTCKTSKKDWLELHTHSAR